MTVWSDQCVVRPRLKLSLRRSLGRCGFGNKSCGLTPNWMCSNKFVAFHRGCGISIMASRDFTHAAQANVLIWSLACGERDEVFDDLTDRHGLGRLKKHTARGEVQRQTLDVIESMTAADQFERESQFESLVLSVFNHVSHLIYKGQGIRSRRMRADSNGCPIVLIQ